MGPADFFLFPKLKLRLKNVLMIGLFIGISVLFREGPTLKAIK